MTFILIPASSHSYYPSSGLCSPTFRPAHRYHGTCSQPRRPQYSSFSHFFGQVDELLGQISHQTQRQAQLDAQQNARNQRQLRKRALRAQFAVSQKEPGWQVDGEIQGFEPENLNIEVTNEYTVKVTGNTKWKLEKNLPLNDTISTVGQEPEKARVDEKNVMNLAATEVTDIAQDSDTESYKSYQATVEDDFEDLGAETSSLISASSESSSLPEAAEPKGKETAEEADNTSKIITSSATQKEDLQEQERQHGSFEQTFRFPQRIDATNVRASFKNGVLSITVPRAPTQPPKMITIS